MTDFVKPVKNLKDIIFRLKMKLSSNKLSPVTISADETSYIINKLLELPSDEPVNSFTNINIEKLYCNDSKMLFVVPVLNYDIIINLNAEVDNDFELKSTYHIYRLMSANNKVANINSYKYCCTFTVAHKYVMFKINTDVNNVLSAGTINCNDIEKLVFNIRKQLNISNHEFDWVFNYNLTNYKLDECYKTI